jgi:hypothetical protein
MKNIIIVLFVVGIIGGIGWYAFKLRDRTACTLEAKLCPDGSSVGRTGPDCRFAPCPDAGPLERESTDPTADWEVYQNDELGFSIRYPDTQNVVDDFYGWPNAVFLLYGGGQSHSFAIEVWDTRTEYEEKYTGQIDAITVHEVRDKFVTLLNNNYDPEVDYIIATFEIL